MSREFGPGQVSETGVSNGLPVRGLSPPAKQGAEPDPDPTLPEKGLVRPKS